jgi:hypothetical protein
MSKTRKTTLLSMWFIKQGRRRRKDLISVWKTTGCSSLTDVQYTKTFILIAKKVEFEIKYSQAVTILTCIPNWYVRYYYI